jgi:hypothetical protein
MVLGGGEKPSGEEVNISLHYLLFLEELIRLPSPPWITVSVHLSVYLSVITNIIDLT